MKIRRQFEWFSLLIIITIIHGLFFQVLHVFSSTNTALNDYNFDVIFVIDHSSSMTEADPDRISRMATNLFIDLLGNSNSRAGYVYFTGSIAAISDLTPIETVSQRESLKNEINRLGEPTGWTDIALGLRRAERIFQEDYSSDGIIRQPIVILLSDGNTALSQYGQRTVDESLAELEIMKERFSEQGIPIFTIGLNHDGNLDFDEMKGIANKTNALSFHIREANELTHILTSIYAAIARARITPIESIQASGLEQNINVNIPNESITDSNVIIFSGQPVTNIRLLNQAGQEIVISEANKILETRSAYYSLLKIIQPQRGDWTVSVIGNSGDNLIVSLMNVYNLDMSLEAEYSEINQGLSQIFKANLHDYDGNRIDDMYLFQEQLTVMQIRNVETNEISQHVFPTGSDSLILDVDFPIGNYEAFVTTDGEITRESSSISFSVIPLSLRLELAQSPIYSDDSQRFEAFYENVKSERVDINDVNASIFESPIKIVIKNMNTGAIYEHEFSEGINSFELQDELPIGDYEVFLAHHTERSETSHFTILPRGIEIESRLWTVFGSEKVDLSNISEIYTPRLHIATDSWQNDVNIHQDSNYMTIKAQSFAWPLSKKTEIPAQLIYEHGQHGEILFKITIYNTLWIIVASLIVFCSILFCSLKLFWYDRIIRERFDVEIRMRKVKAKDTLPILIGRCTVKPHLHKLMKPKFSLQELCLACRNIGSETLQVGFDAKTIDINKTNGELLQLSEANERFRMYSFEGRKSWFILKVDGKLHKGFTNNEMSFLIIDTDLNIEYGITIIKK